MAAPAQHDPATKDRIRPETRALAAVIVPILVAAWIMLYLLPHDTERLFSWPVRPTMTAMMLGGTYLGGAYFFSQVVLGRRWHEVALGFLPVAALSAILGLATVAHWDRFTHGHISFVLWVILYFSLPFVLPLVWYRNRAEGDGPRTGVRMIDQPLRYVFGGLGVVFTVVGLLLLAVPEVMIPTWPWELSPLTARVLAAMFVLSGLVALGIARDGRWTAARRIVEAQTLAIMLILYAAVRARGEFDWSRPVSWLFVAGLVAVLGCILVMVLRARPRDGGRTRRPGATGRPS